MPGSVSMKILPDMTLTLTMDALTVFLGFALSALVLGGASES